MAQDAEALRSLEQACKDTDGALGAIRRRFLELESGRGAGDFFPRNARHCPVCLARNHPMLHPAAVAAG
eukprot:15017187-Alexandrium_andersonii.AAC.1